MSFIVLISATILSSAGVIVVDHAWNSMVQINYGLLYWLWSHHDLLSWISIGSAVALVVWAAIAWFWGPTQSTAAPATTPNQKELSQLQATLGQKAFEAVKLAASENLEHFARTNGDAGPMRVTQLSHNAGAHSVFVYLSGTNGWYGGREDTMYFALQLNISTRDNRVYALLGRYSPSEEDTIDNFDVILSRVCDHVRSWQLYQREAA